MESNQVEKVAILGGGIGSLTTAFELAKQKNNQGLAKYDVTIYQLGWRLGGKLATGRNQEKGQRIEEHGIHGFLGCYYNAGEMMSEVFKMLGSIENLEGFFTKFDDAFSPQTSVIMWENEKDEWHPWKVTVPSNDKSYGNVGEVADYRNRIVGLLQFLGLQLSHGPDEKLKYIGERVLRELDGEIMDFLQLGKWVVETVDKIWLLVRPLLETYYDISHDDKLRQLLILVDFNCALLTGFFVDEIPQKGFASIDEQNYADWLTRHGASKMTIDSAFTKNTPDITYNFRGGDASKDAEMAAGSFLQWSLRLYGFIGSFVLAFKAGSGETILAPIYRSLKEMGVKFEFFHKVQKLNVCPKQKIIHSVDIDIQATVKGGGEYDPLVGPIKGLMCWPSKPVFERLEQGKALEKAGINLESWWSPWEKIGEKKIVAGEDFDHLVLGISIGAHKFICEDLIDDDTNKPLIEQSTYATRWGAMVGEIETVQTQAMQLWFKEEMPVYLNKSLILPKNDKWVSGTYASPDQGQVDFSDLIPVEKWPDDGPKGIFYICGPKKDTGFPPFTDFNFPRSQSQLVKQDSIDYLNSFSGAVLPDATTKDGFGFDSLYSADESPSFDYQYWRANIDPSERYVTALPGASKYRLNAWDSGYTNLSLTGDWINTGLNVGSVEGTVMGGKLASYAISNSPPLDKIYGFDPFGLN